MAINTKEVFDEACDFVRALNNKAHFDEVHSIDQFYSWQRWFDGCVTNPVKGWGRFKICHGCTKMVFVFADKDYVIKMDLEENEPWMMVETINYELMRDNGYGEYFAPTYIAGVVNGRRIYVQEKACVDEWKLDSYMSDVFEDESFSYDDEESSSVIYRYFHTVEPDRADAILELMEELKINDIHNENWGLTKDGRWIIIDFSGYSYDPDFFKNKGIDNLGEQQESDLF